MHNYIWVLKFGKKHTISTAQYNFLYVYVAILFREQLAETAVLYKIRSVSPGVVAKAFDLIVVVHIHVSHRECVCQENYVLLLQLHVWQHTHTHTHTQD